MAINTYDVFAKFQGQLRFFACILEIRKTTKQVSKVCQKWKIPIKSRLIHIAYQTSFNNRMHSAAVAKQVHSVYKIHDIVNLRFEIQVGHSDQNVILATEQWASKIRLIFSLGWGIIC